MIVLNSNQIRLFNLIPQPVINISEEHIAELAEENVESSSEEKQSPDTSKKNDPMERVNYDLEWAEMNSKKSSLEKAIEGFAAYKELNLHKYDQTVQDKMLIQMMDPQLKKLYDEILKNELINNYSSDSKMGQPSHKVQPLMNNLNNNNNNNINNNLE